ncbi:MAG: glycosyltransferase family 39 protein, partial [Candidatus Levyibacteriota bacterium]
MNKKIWLLLFGIVLLATVLRLWQLGSVPLSPDWDEAALGYNAYSILHTGRDEFGKFLPVVLRSFDDYKPALYAYLAIPTVFVFGLTVFAVRLPSALFGILTVFATFFLIQELFKNNKIALLTTFFLAISPWHIQFSRVAFEANVGVAFNVFAILIFLKSFKRPWLLPLFGVLMALNLYVYQSEKVFTPLLFLLLVGVFYKKLLLFPKKIIVITIV